MAVTFKIAKSNEKARKKLGDVLENLEGLLQNLRSSKEKINWKDMERTIAMIHEQIIRVYDLIE